MELSILHYLNPGIIDVHGTKNIGEYQIPNNSFQVVIIGFKNEKNFFIVVEK